MVKNKNLQFAFAVFAITLTLLFAFAELYPVDSIAQQESIASEKAQSENLALTAQ